MAALFFVGEEEDDASSCIIVEGFSTFSSNIMSFSSSICDDVLLGLLDVEVGDVAEVNVGEYEVADRTSFPESFCISFAFRLDDMLSLIELESGESGRVKMKRIRLDRCVI